MKKTSTMYLWILFVIAFAGVTAPALTGAWNDSTFQPFVRDDGGATTYTWDGSADTDYQNAANWTPARTAPAANDVLIFDGAVTAAPIVTNIPTQTVGQLLFTNNVSATFGNGTNSLGASTLSVSSGSGLGEDSFSIAAGSSLTINGGSGTSGNFSVRIAGTNSSTGNIAGTLILTGSSNNGLTLSSNFIVTVSGTIENTATIGGSSATNLFFTATGIYDHNFSTTSGTVPTATWNASSQTRIEGYTTNTNPPGGVTNQNFGNFTWNSTGQTTNINLSGAVVNVQTTFTVASTGTGSLRLGANTSGEVNTVNYAQTGGIFDLSSGTGNGTLRVSGTFNQSGGTLTETGSGTTNLIEFNGAANQSVTIGTTANHLNYRISNPNGITLTGTLEIRAQAFADAFLRISTTAAAPIAGTGSVVYNNTASNRTVLIYDAGTAGSAGGNQTATALVFPATGGPGFLTVNNPGAAGSNTVSIPFDRTIAGGVSIADGIIDMGGNTLSLGSSATISPSFCAVNQADRHVIGNLRKTFGSNANFTFTVGTADGCTTVDLTSVTATGSPNLTVRAVNTTLPGLNPPRALSRYWAIIPPTQGTLSAILTFKYRDDDVNGIESDYRIYKRETAGTITNQCPSAPCVDTGFNTVTLPAATSSFSDWSAGEQFAPTSASVNVGGRVRQANGRGIFRARVTMTDSGGNVRMAFTNQFGYFRFDAIPAGENYVFSATHRRYQFAQPTQVRFIGEDTDGVDFTATGENGNFRPEATFFDNAPFDFDGDGRTDAAVYRHTDQSWHINRSSDNALTVQAFGAAGDRLTPADYDGDGKTDIAVFRPSEGNWYVWLSSSNSLRVENFGAESDRPIAADFDGDGKADLSVWNGMRGVWQVRHSSNGAIVTERFRNGKGNFTALASDRDGDGRADFVFFNELNGTWKIRLSESGETVEEQFGQKGDRAASGDFDGDARGDLAVYRASENAWVVRLSGGKESADLRLPVNADNPLFGDFDGDGKTDAAGFSDGVWSVHQSVNGVVRQQQFGLAGDTAIPSAFDK